MTRSLVWDASPLVHASAIDRLDVLGDLAAGPKSTRWSHRTTAAVAEEVTRLGGEIPAWVEVVHVDAIGELRALGRWIERVSSETHSHGEATVCAWAECHAATAIIDDADARRVAAGHGLDVHGVLWVGAQAIEQERWSASSVGRFFDAMLASGARYPFEPGGYEYWAQRHALVAAR